MTPDDVGALNLLARIAANVELANKGYLTPSQAFDRIRKLLAHSNCFEPVSLAHMNGLPTKVGDSPETISAPAGDRSPQRSQSQS